MELILRVKTVLRRCESESVKDPLVVGGVSLSVGKRAVSADGNAVPLTFKEFELLNTLMVNKGVVLTRDKLLDLVWGFGYPGESRTVDMHIKTLRQKLGTCAGLIQTVRNVGYKMEG